MNAINFIRLKNKKRVMSKRIFSFINRGALQLDCQKFSDIIRDMKLLVKYTRILFRQWQRESKTCSKPIVTNIVWYHFQASYTLLYSFLYQYLPFELVRQWWISPNFLKEKRQRVEHQYSTEKEASLKKPREENPDDSIGLETDDVFSQGLKSPECVKILFNCLQNLKTEMKSVKEISLAAKDWQIKGTEQLIDMSKAIKFINKKFDKFEKDLKKKEDEMRLNI